jgi:putative membrane protein
MGWGGIGMALFWIVLLVAIAAAVVSFSRRPAGPSGDRSLDIVRERYARGEITREQFDELKRDLEKK